MYRTLSDLKNPPRVIANSQSLGSRRVYDDDDELTGFNVSLRLKMTDLFSPNDTMKKLVQIKSCFHMNRVNIVSGL